MSQTVAFSFKTYPLFNVLIFKPDLSFIIFKRKLGILILTLISYSNEGIRYLSIGFQTIMCYKVT